MYQNEPQAVVGQSDRNPPYGPYQDAPHRQRSHHPKQPHPGGGKSQNGDSDRQDHEADGEAEAPHQLAPRKHLISPNITEPPHPHK